MRQGTRPPAPRDCRYDWPYIFGAVCPARGTSAALVMPHADKQAMTLHLAEISQAVAPGAHPVVLMDGTGWHKPGSRLVLPGNVSTLTLPAYAPELNPQENVWQFLRQNHLANRVFATYDAIVDDCCNPGTTSCNNQNASPPSHHAIGPKRSLSEAVGISPSRRTAG